MSLFSSHVRSDGIICNYSLLICTIEFFRRRRIWISFSVKNNAARSLYLQFMNEIFAAPFLNIQRRTFRLQIASSFIHVNTRALSAGTYFHTLRRERLHSEIAFQLVSLYTSRIDGSYIFPQSRYRSSYYRGTVYFFFCHQLHKWCT